MPIDFSPSRWDAVKETYRRFWAGTLGRPVISAEIVNRDAGRPQPSLGSLSQANAAKLEIPVEDLVERTDWELSRLTYLGDAYPYINLDCFGPGIAAGFLGARVDDSTGRIWFHPPSVVPIQDLHFEYDPDNIWLRRVKDLAAALVKRWQGQVLVGMADLGGAVDILSTFRPSELLLLDLYDHPDHVLRLIWELHELWHQYYREINEVLQPLNPGYSDWSNIYSDTPSYILQCDFCYMISPEMFSQFVLPELTASVGRLSRSFYHLDGIGSLPHQDKILKIPGLGGMQWVPGAGQPHGGRWPEVQGKISRAGLRMQIHSSQEALDDVVAQFGVGKGIHSRVMRFQADQENQVRQWMARHGVE